MRQTPGPYGPRGGVGRPAQHQILPTPEVSIRTRTKAIPNTWCDCAVSRYRLAKRLLRRAPSRPRAPSRAGCRSSETSISSQAEGPHHLDQDHGRRRRSSARGPGCSPGTRSRSASGSEERRQSMRWTRLQPQAVAMDPIGVVGLELLVDRGQRGRRAGDGDRVRPAAIGLGGDRALDQVADVGGEVLELVRVRRVGAQVALGLADRARLERGVEVDLARRSRRSARSSRRRCRRPGSARRRAASAVAPR